MAAKITSSNFGKTKEGCDVTLYTITSSTTEVSVIDYGATITCIKCMDKNKKMDDVVTGFSIMEGYYEYSRYFGSTVGRVCNRIAKGKFTLNGQQYNLPINNGPNSLHGGLVGFDKKMWKAEITGNNTLAFSLESDDGEEGYPGKLHVTTKFVLNGDELLIHYTATTDKDTIVSLTNHSYFNLAGHEDWKEIYDHKIGIYADHVLPVDSTSIPTGEISPVENTVFDLRQPKVLSKEILQSVPGNGYDHNYCLGLACERKLAARVEHERSGRVLVVETTQPGLQFYTANYLNNEPGKQGVKYSKQSCFCLETQCWPNAVNQENFPNCILKSGEEYDHKTWYTFSTTS